MTTTTSWRDELAPTIDHFNGGHADTVLLVARFAAGAAEAVAAELVAIDETGAVLVVTERGADAAGSRSVRASFERTVASSDDAFEQLTEVLGRARALAGDDEPLTSYERERAVTATLPTFAATVVGVGDVTPGLRSLVVEVDGDLAAVHGRCRADDFVYLMVPRHGAALPPGYAMADFMAADDDERPRGAYYTVRRWDPATRRLELWVVRHGDGHSDGIGVWIDRAAVGEGVALWGPRVGHEVPPDAAGYLLVADDTGIPAVVGLLEEVPAGLPVHVVIETVDEAHVVDLPTTPDHHVTWCYRGDDEPGTGTRLLDVVSALDLPRDGLVVVGAGESRQMTALRRLVRQGWGRPATHVDITGYWRRDLR